MFALLFALFAADYANPKLLVEPSDVAGKEFVILDARPKKDFDAGHVPGAVHVDSSLWARTFAKDQKAKTWEKLIGEVAIDGKKPVVIYDDKKGNVAARLWWILRYWGIDDVRLVNGGWPAYKAAGGKVETRSLAPKA